jgi:[acyl-carrier-protein] S-malonyltransferase
MSFALVFSGQGAQHPAMLPWLDEGEIVRSMCDRLGRDDWRAAFAEPAWAHRNDHAQLLLTGLALAAWQQLAPALPTPCALAGYSVGELAAFSAAGVFDAAAALDLAVARAAAMDRCAAHAPGSLVAVTGLSPQAIDALCESAGVGVAIRNGGHSVVLGGPRNALAAAERGARAQGARCTPLKVGIASHTRWMQEAATEFLEVLSHTPLSKPRVALFSNAADRVVDEDGARQALATQIASAVRWDECMENLHARQVDCVLEIGPGQALARMWNERYPQVPARSCDEFRSAKAIINWVEARSGHASIGRPT